MTKPKIFEISDPDTAAAKAIETALGQALMARGAASLMVSGGSSPKAVYQILSQADLAWDKVSIGLVDERWVEEDASGSNAAFIKACLLQNKAAAARFIPMKTNHVTPEAGLEMLAARFKDCPAPFDICVMGMGLDGHTASWFPKSQGLAPALDVNNPGKFCAINAQGCPVAGDYPQRISLTLSAVLAARNIILFIPGHEKKAVYFAAKDKSIFDAPVQSLDQAGDTLSVYVSQ